MEEICVLQTQIEFRTKVGERTQLKTFELFFQANCYFQILPLVEPEILSTSIQMCFDLHAVRRKFAVSVLFPRRRCLIREGTLFLIGGGGGPGYFRTFL